MFYMFCGWIIALSWYLKAVYGTLIAVIFINRATVRVSGDVKRICRD